MLWRYSEQMGEGINLGLGRHGATAVMKSASYTLCAPVGVCGLVMALLTPSEAMAALSANTR